MMKNAWVQWLVEQVREFGPYVAVELVLPGGTLIALALWLYRNRSLLSPRQGAPRWRLARKA